MKKRTVCLLLAGLLLAGLLGAFLIGCSSDKAWLKQLSELSGTDLSGGKKLSDRDTHGGFLGDGERLARFSYSGEALLWKITSSDRWKPVPPADQLAGLGWRAEAGPELAREIPIPADGAGYYCFLDRQAETWDPEGEAVAFLRPSVNFTVLIYDAGEKILTVYEMDT